MGRLNQSTVQDLCAAKERVALLQEEPDLGLILPHIARTPSVGLAGKRLGRQESGRLHRRCRDRSPRPQQSSSLCHRLLRASTLAAETQAISEARSECEWIRGVVGAMT
eukprot:8762366-Alexandrium_andersonii.AAC.1